MDRETAELVAVLNEAISAEYGALFLLPQHIAQVEDEETKRQLKLIEEMELEHAEKTARLIYQLGSEPKADLPLLRPSMGLKAIIETQTEAEHKAIGIYGRAERLARDPETKQLLASLRKDEEGHLRLLERIRERVG